MNLTGEGVDDPDVNFYENYYSTSDAQLHAATRIPRSTS